MFYNYVKTAWANSEVRIGLPVNNSVESVSFETSSFTRLACLLLNNQEKDQLMHLARTDAQEFVSSC